MPCSSAAPWHTQVESQVLRVTEFVACDYAIFATLRDQGWGDRLVMPTEREDATALGTRFTQSGQEPIPRHKALKVTGSGVACSP